MKFTFFLSAILLLFFSCSDKNSRSSFFYEIKSLEYNRSSNIRLWQSIYKDAEKKIKKEILISGAKTKNDSLAPFFNEILQSETDSEILSLAIFALGQLQTEGIEDKLIQLFETSNSIPVKRSIVAAFEHCGSEKCIPILVKGINHDSLRTASLQAAGILGRKKTELGKIKTITRDSTWAYNNLEENAYFIYNSVTNADFESISEQIVKTKNITQKYYLRALSKLTASKSIPKDSLVISKTRQNLRTVLSVEAPWQNKMYALQAFTFFADSSDEGLLKTLTNASNLNVKIEAYKAFGNIFRENGSAYLLNGLKNENDYTLKGKIIYTLAEISPTSAYRLIMQNLDKGPVSFKQDLLKSLALYNDPIALSAIKNFLMVKDQRLAGTAFEILNSKKMIQFKDIIELMESHDFIKLYNALDWQLENKHFVANETLLNAFKSLNDFEKADIQSLILDVFKHQKTPPAGDILNQLSKNISNKTIAEKFVEMFPDALKPGAVLQNNTPDYLMVDSLMNLPDENIIVEMTTNKGEIVLELFVNDAPMTVQNFIKLSMKKFYDGLIFHRVIADFIIQGGDPQGTGWGSTDYTIPSEDFLPFERGTIGIATSGFDTGSCQFFICQSKQPHLQGNYTAFGKVVKGMDVVDNIQVDDRIIDIRVSEN